MQKCCFTIFLKKKYCNSVKVIAWTAQRVLIVVAGGNGIPIFYSAPASTTKGLLEYLDVN